MDKGYMHCELCPEAGNEKSGQIKSSVVDLKTWHKAQYKSLEKEEELKQSISSHLKKSTIFNVFRFCPAFVDMSAS